MCPDREILSVYLDGELPSPWKEKLESHFTSCPECKARFERFKGYSHELGNLPGPLLVEAAQERVWRNLGAAKWAYKESRNLWRRTIAVPLPAVAAAVALFLVAFAAVFARQPAASAQIQDLTASAGMGLDAQGISPVSDIGRVLQYLGDQDTGDIVIIRLPETKSFQSAGEPALIKAADYSRRNMSQ